MNDKAGEHSNKKIPKKTAEDIKGDMEFDKLAVECIMSTSQHLKLDPARLLKWIRSEVDPEISKVLPDD